MRETSLIEFLNENHWTIGSVESFTGGLFAKTLTDVPGASKVFKGSLITYSNETKVRLLAIPQETLTKHGAVSKEIASLMAVNGKKALNVDICVSFTGNAGPDIMDQLPVGTCFIGIATAQSQKVFRLSLAGTRQEIRKAAVEFAFGEVLKFPFASK